MKTLPKTFCFLPVLLLAGCSADGIAKPDPPTTAVAFAGGTITAEVASTSAARDVGLMNRATLGSSTGMLFVFASDQIPPFGGFWMKNTSIPLSIAFIDSNQRVVSVQDMAPFDTVNIHRPGVPYRYALEVNQGWFAAHAVSASSMASFTLPAGTIISR